MNRIFVKTESTIKKLMMSDMFYGFGYTFGTADAVENTADAVENTADAVENTADAVAEYILKGGDC